MIVFQNVTKKFGKLNEALKKISFSIDKGEFIFLIGPSGAGKTTLLKLLLGDLKSSGGKILIDGQEISKLQGIKIARLRRKIRMIFQDFKILFDRTILENVSLSLHILGVKSKEAESEAYKMLKLVGLDGRENYFPIQISAGELQRVAIARALAGSPIILLADEPTGNLDPKTGGEILDLLEKINKEGTTVIVATHNASLVDSRKKRIIALFKGEIKRDEKEGKYDPS